MTLLHLRSYGQTTESDTNCSWSTNELAQFAYFQKTTSRVVHHSETEFVVIFCPSNGYELKHSL